MEIETTTYRGLTLKEAAEKAVDIGTLGAWEWFQSWFNGAIDDDDPPDPKDW